MPAALILAACSGKKDPNADKGKAPARTGLEEQSSIQDRVGAKAPQSPDVSPPVADAAPVERKHSWIRELKALQELLATSGPYKELGVALRATFPAEKAPHECNEADELLEAHRLR